MAAILQTTFANDFHEIKCLSFDLNFTAICSTGSTDNESALLQNMPKQQAINWTNDDLVNEQDWGHED